MYARVTETGNPERVIQYYTDDKGLDGWFDVQAARQGEDGVVLTFMNVIETPRKTTATLQRKFAGVAVRHKVMTCLCVIKFGVSLF